MVFVKVEEMDFEHDANRCLKGWVDELGFLAFWPILIGVNEKYVHIHRYSY